MRQMRWLDKDGWAHVSLIRDEDPDEAAEQGIPIGPPDVGALDWTEVCKRINNELVEAGILTWQDVVRSQSGVTHIVERVVRKQIIELFRQQDRDLKEAQANE